MSPPPRPTAAELEILNVLWDRGPSTVREVCEVIGGDTGYTTVLKLLQIMFGKQLVTRDDRERSHVYRPAHDRAAIQATLARDLVDRAFAGSSVELAMRALAGTRPSADELTRIRELLDDLAGQRSPRRSR